jgi:hypothetical protein
MTLFRRTAALLATTVVGSCSSTAPTAPNGFLTGAWFRGNTAEYMTITLTSSGGTVEGTVLDVWIASPIQAKGTVTGTYGGGGFTLTLTFPPGTQRWFGDKATLTGHVVTSSLGDDDELQGEWRQTAPADSLIGDFLFTRQPAGDP